MAAGEQLAEVVDDPALAVPLERRERHPEEVELDGRSALDDREVVVERRVRVGVADDDPCQVGALRLEDRRAGRARPRLDRVGRDRQAGPAGGPGRGPVDPFLLGREPRLVGPDLADDPGPDAGPADARRSPRGRSRRPGRRRSAGRSAPRPGSGPRGTSRSPSRCGGRSRGPARRARPDRGRRRRGSGRRRSPPPAARNAASSSTITGSSRRSSQ